MRSKALLLEVQLKRGSFVVKLAAKLRRRLESTSEGKKRRGRELSPVLKT